MAPRSSATTGAAKPHASPAIPLGLELSEPRSIIFGGLLGRTGGVELRHAVREPDHGGAPFGPAHLPLAAIDRPHHHTGPVNLMQHLEVLAVQATAKCDVLLTGKVPHG